MKSLVSYGSGLYIALVSAGLCGRSHKDKSTSKRNSSTILDLEDLPV